MPINKSQFQDQIAANIADIHHGLATIGDLLKKYPNIDAEPREPKLERIINNSDYLQRRLKLYLAIQNSERLDLYAQILPLLEEYETKIQYLYFHKEQASYAFKADLQDACAAAANMQEKSYIAAQIEICTLEIVVQHLELVLIQNKITDLLQITNLLAELEPQIRKQQLAYNQYIRKLTETTRYKHLLDLESRLANQNSMQSMLVQNQSKLFGLRLEEHFAYCLLQDAIKNKTMPAPIQARFELIIRKYAQFHTSKYSNPEAIATDFIVDTKLLEDIMALDVSLGELGFPNSEEIIELYAHSLLAVEDDIGVPPASTTTDQVDALARDIMATNKGSDVLTVAVKPRSKIIL